ncbi:unnamed protein product [Schistosoma mattheei]|uniref:Uncharacterized protein n=1 Tax=Schistosoma mattheei TaxID=31246 RepID=A0A183P551_9TREM|nr:unnamed protein product [Schistosoma mattheei]
MQEKTVSVAAASAVVGHVKNNKKVKILKYDKESTNPITFDGETLEEVKHFTFLDSIIDEQGKYDADAKAMVGKIRKEFIQSNNIWNSKQLSQSQYQIGNLQYERRGSSTVRSWRNLHQKCTDIYKRLSTQDTQCPLVGYHQ